MSDNNRPPRYIYQRHGQPLVSWIGGPPSARRAAETRGLGGLGSIDGSSLGPKTYVLPRPGAPEYLSAMDGCGHEHDSEGEYLVMARGRIPRRDKVDLALDIANLALTGGAIYMLFRFLKSKPA